MNDEEKKITELVKESFDNTTDVLSDAASGVPSPIRKNMFKAVGQLCTVALDIPIANLEGIAAEKRAETRSRVKLIDTQADLISSQMKAEPEYVRAAIRKYGEKIVRERGNLDSITKIAIKELSNGAQAQNNNVQIPDISQDWLNTFEKEACDKSSDEMKKLFGKILAGEICKPSTYSIRTIKILSQLDTEAADVFRTLASLASTMRVGDLIADSRVIFPGKNAELEILKKYEITFYKLNTVQEHGLIIADYHSYANYMPCIANDNNEVYCIFTFQGKKFTLKRIDASKPIQSFLVYGVVLTKAGRELLDIIDIKPNQQYKNKLFEFFATAGFQCVEVNGI